MSDAEDRQEVYEALKPWEHTLVRIFVRQGGVGVKHVGYLSFAQTEAASQGYGSQPPDVITLSDEKEGMQWPPPDPTLVLFIAELGQFSSQEENDEKAIIFENKSLHISIQRENSA